MMFWNRREVLITISMVQCAEVCSRLANSGLRYDYATISSETRSGMGGRTIPIAQSEGNPSNCVYKVYVHKDDLQKAKDVLREIVN